MSDLIKRVESARGPDRGLDGLIARDIDGWIPHFDLEGDRLVEWPGYGGHWHRPKTHPKQGACKARSDSYPGFERECPAYTSSLDAAVSLCERVMKTHPHGPLWTRRHDIRCDNKADPYCFVEITVPSREYQGQHRSEPLALVLAVLRAVG